MSIPKAACDFVWSATNLGREARPQSLAGQKTSDSADIIRYKNSRHFFLLFSSILLFFLSVSLIVAAPFLIDPLHSPELSSLNSPLS